MQSQNYYSIDINFQYLTYIDNKSYKKPDHLGPDQLKLKVIFKIYFKIRKNRLDIHFLTSLK